VAYEVLCRRHHMRRMTASTARAAAPSAQTLASALPLDG
jgi:thymidine kinase